MESNQNDKMKTPETEAAALGNFNGPNFVDADFARKLERERNDARQHVRELVETCDRFYIEREDGTTKTFSEALKAAKHYLQSVTS